MMNNIKTIEVIKALPGLEVGDTLSRRSETDNFELIVETVTEDYTAKRHIALSPSLINKKEFKATEWFAPKKSTAEKLEEAQETIVELRAKISRDSEKVAKYDKVMNRIETKINEFQAASEKLDKELANELMSSERMEWADEAFTVYYNMTDLLKKIKA